MKKSILILMAIFYSSLAFSQGHYIVSLEESKSFGHALGWIVTFNFFVPTTLLLPFIKKKIIHYTFPPLFLISIGVGYLIIHAYNLNVFSEIILFVLCVVPSIGIYTHSIIYMYKIYETIPTKQKKEIVRKKVFKRYAVSKLFHPLLVPLVSAYLYIYSQTPIQKRKKCLRRMGWDVDNPEKFPKHLILHRKKNSLLVCAVSKSWKRIPISQTRSLSSLSLEVQKEIELILESIKIDIVKLYEKEHVSPNEPSIVFGKRKSPYALASMISKIESKTPLGISFLRKHIENTLKSTFNQRKIH